MDALPRPTLPAPAVPSIPSQLRPPVDLSVTNAEVTRAREALRALVHLSGLSRREVERQLSAQGHGVSLTRLLAGRLEIKLRHVLDITRILGIDPLELFRRIFEERAEAASLAQRLAPLFAGRPGSVRRRLGPPPPPGDIKGQRWLRDFLWELERLVTAARDPKDLDRQVDELMRELGLPPILSDAGAAPGVPAEVPAAKDQVVARRRGQRPATPAAPKRPR